MPSFRLYQPKILDLLKAGGESFDGQRHTAKDFFRTAMARSFSQIASGYDCEINMAGRRLDEARELWTHDVSNTKIEDSKDPDHLKQAGFLTYWLRRRIVIAVNHEREGSSPSQFQKDFLRYGNEICSLLTGFRIALYFEAEKKYGKPRLEQLQSVNLDLALVKEIAVLLHHKNVSPHALYLLFRGLFHPIQIPGPESGNVLPFRPTVVR